jgi:phosphate transport system substrate-binding protein
MAGIASAQINLTGAGATFPNPIYSKWFNEFHKLNPNIQINYQSLGSGAGIKQVTEGTVDFGASDGPMSDDQIKEFHDKRGTNILHFPTVLGAVVPTYNLPGVTADLNFTPEVLAGIFLGKITKWNDARIKALNPSAALPDQAIVVVHRSDGSGTTYIWVDYLCKISPEWEKEIGRGTSVKWPVGLGGKGNEGVAGQVKNAPGSLGYVELAYAITNKLPAARIKNQAGKLVEPTIESTTAAAAGAVKSMPDDFRVSLTNAPGADAYPIASFTWLLVYKDQPNEAKGKALVKFLWWAIHDGQRHPAALLYAPLPAPVVKQIEAKIKQITFSGKPLLAAQ